MEQPTPFPFGKGSSPQDAREQKSPSRPLGVMNRVAGLFRPKQTDGKENVGLPRSPTMVVNFLDYLNFWWGINGPIRDTKNAYSGENERRPPFIFYHFNSC